MIQPELPFHQLDLIQSHSMLRLSVILLKIRITSEPWCAFTAKTVLLTPTIFLLKIEGFLQIRLGDRGASKYLTYLRSGNINIEAARRTLARDHHPTEAKRFRYYAKEFLY